MEKKFIVPAVTMLTGILVLIAFFILYGTGVWMNELTPWSEVILYLVAGGLVVFSGWRCRHVGGPRAGNVFRTVLLFLMAAYTYWKIGIAAAGVLMAAAIATGVLALMKSNQPEDAGDPISTSSQTTEEAD